MKINALKLVNGQATQLQGLEVTEVLDLIHSQEFSWIDIEISSADGEDLEDLLVKSLDFHPATLEDCFHPTPYHQPKIDEEQDYKFITFLYFDQPPSDAKLAPQEINIYISLTYVITVHRHECPELLAKFASLPRHFFKYEERPMLLLHHILDTIVDGFAQHLTEIQTRSIGLELNVLKGKPTPRLSLGMFSRQSRHLSDMRVILRTRQALVRLRRTLSAELEIIDKLISEYDYEGAPEESEEIAIYFRDIADHIKKYLEIIESHDSTMNHLMEVQNLVTGHRTNEIIYILTILSAILLPLNLIVGFFGMNFTNLWFAHDAWGIWLVTGSMVFISIIMLALFKNKGWI